jgi:hypothetical protein
MKANICVSDAVTVVTEELLAKYGDQEEADLSGPFWIIQTFEEWQAVTKGAVLSKEPAKEGTVALIDHHVAGMVVRVATIVGKGPHHVKMKKCKNKHGKHHWCFGGGGEDLCNVDASTGACAKGTCLRPNCCPGIDSLGHAFCNCQTVPCPD